jgi:nucleoside 2-deoxyribosyltransferase
MKSVVICGSNKFAKEARAFGKALEKLGVEVFMPHFYRASGGKWDELKDFDKPFVALGLTHDHFYKIRLADAVFIYNKDGYSGNSTTLEIGYAVACDKPIYAFSEKDEEICRSVLFRGVVTTPKDLVRLLK